MMRPAIIIALLVLCFAACKKEENPFEQLEHNSPNPPSEALPQDNFAWLHQRVFRPVCANSGCHDGNFEPDFRSIGSAYNSLVFHPVIANDPGNSFTYRVLPGNVQMSFLHERLTTFVPNTSGTMPLETDGPDWPQNQGLYIAAISFWIQSGAPNMFGTPPSLGNLEPQVTGCLAFAAGNTTSPLPRGTDPGVQPIEVPAGNVDLWFSFSDDSTASNAFTFNKFKIATSVLGFATVPELSLSTGSAITGLDFGNTNATFTHKAALDLASYPIGSQLFVRVYVDDGDHPEPTEVPNDGTGSPMVDYFTLMIVP
ncbi:MAG: hypothetical protein IPP33_19125 [Flavobacteriales bacterium]|nr:hypothetical protein [Flavobacteriales bacterium]